MELPYCLPLKLVHGDSGIIAPSNRMSIVEMKRQPRMFRFIYLLLGDTAYLTEYDGSQNKTS